jgi:hypothetical protein
LEELNKVDFPKLIKMTPYIKQYSQNDAKPPFHFSNVTQDSSICDNEGNLSEFDYPETPLSNMILTKNWLMKQIQSTYINIHLLNPILNNPNAFYVLD